MKQVLQAIESMESRALWYRKAIKIGCGEIPWENHFDFPSSINNDPHSADAIWEWRGAYRELCNSIDMLRAAINYIGGR